MPSAPTLADHERDQRRSLFKLWGISLLVTAALFGLAFYVMGPSPPRHIVLATGSQEGVYYRYAKAYAEVLAEDGVEVEIKTTAGSVENLDLLMSGEGDVDVAFVQGGTATDEQRQSLQSIASVFLEPVWVFYRADLEFADLTSLGGLRVACGPRGSGTRALALHVLEHVGLATGEVADGVRVLPLGGAEAARALLEGEVDGAFFVVGAEAAFSDAGEKPGYLEGLFASDRVKLYSVRRHLALARRNPFLADVLIPEGLLDLPRNIPSHDIHLVAPTAALVARQDLHTAIVHLFIKAARRVHAEGNPLTEPGQFPSPHHLDVPLGEDARRYFARGPSWLYRAFPFRLASFLDRAIILLLPLLTLLIPLLKTAPPLYRWGIRRRIYLWYRVLRSADRTMAAGAGVAALEAEVEKLSAIQAEVADVQVPLSYMEEFYSLRFHIDFMRQRLEERVAELRSSEGEADSPEATG